MSGGKLQGSAGSIFWRAISNGNVIVAESVAREFERLPFDYALALVRLYGVKQTDGTSRPRSAISSG